MPLRELAKKFQGEQVVDDEAEGRLKRKANAPALSD
jgi:hypothetical protein